MCKYLREWEPDGAGRGADEVLLRSWGLGVTGGTRGTRELESQKGEVGEANLRVKGRGTRGFRVVEKDRGDIAGGRAGPSWLPPVYPPPPGPSGHSPLTQHSPAEIGVKNSAHKSRWTRDPELMTASPGRRTGFGKWMNYGNQDLGR